MKKPIYYILILLLSLSLDSCFNRLIYGSDGPPERLTITTPKGWVSEGLISTHENTFVEIKDMVIYENKPVILVQQANVLQANNNVFRDHKIMQFDGGNWLLISNDNEKGIFQWVSNLTVNKESMFRMYGWMRVQYFFDGDWIDMYGKKGYSPVWPDQGHSYDPGMVMNENNEVYVAWKDGDYVSEDLNSTEGHMSVSRGDGSDFNWMGERAFQNGGALPQMQLTSDGTPYVMFCDFDPEVYERDHITLSCRKFENGNWEYVGKRSFNPGAVDLLNFEFKIENDIPYVFFKYVTDWTIKPVTNQVPKIALMKLEGSNWKHVGALVCRDAPYCMNLDFTSKGDPVISYVDNFHFIKTLIYSNGQWSEIGELGAVQGRALKTGEKLQGYSLSDLVMAIDDNDDIHVVVKQASSLNTANGPYRSIQLLSYKCNAY